MSSKQIIFEPQPKQQEFLDAVFSQKYSVLTYGGAIGGGKSFVGIAALIILAKVYPKSKWVIIRESLPTLKRTSLETFKKVLPTNFLKAFNSQDYTATFTNGSQIMFMAEDYANDKDFDRFKGLEVNGFLLEQIEELQRGLLDVCLMRAGRHKIPGNPKPLILANVNPTQMWPREYIYDRYNKGTLPADWFYLPATIFDNPVLAKDETYMNQLKNLDSLTYNRLINGDWNAFAVNKPFAYAFEEVKHVHDSIQYDPDAELLLSFDFNVDPITCIAAQHIDGQLRIIKSFKIDNSDIYELCERVTAEYGPHNPLYIVTGDASGRARTAITRGNLNYYRVIKSQLSISDNQMKVPGTNPAIKDSRVLVNSMLQNYDIVMDRENCQPLIYDLKYVETDEEGDIKKDRSTNARKADQLDCFRYLLNTHFKGFIKNLGQHPVVENETFGYYED